MADPIRTLKITEHLTLEVRDPGHLIYVVDRSGSTEVVHQLLQGRASKVRHWLRAAISSGKATKKSEEVVNNIDATQPQ